MLAIEDTERQNFSRQVCAVNCNLRPQKAVIGVKILGEVTINPKRFRKFNNDV